MFYSLTIFIYKGSYSVSSFLSFRKNTWSGISAELRQGVPRYAAITSCLNVPRGPGGSAQTGVSFRRWTGTETKMETGTETETFCRRFVGFEYAKSVYDIQTQNIMLEQIDHGTQFPDTPENVQG